MNEILQSVNDAASQAQKLCSVLQNAINYAHNITSEAEAKLKMASDKEALNVLESANLSSREAKVSKIENIIKLEADGRALDKKNGEDFDRLSNERSAFEKTKNEALKDIAQKTAKLTDDNALLDKSWNDLRAKEKSYKAEIEAEIMKRFK